MCLAQFEVSIDNWGKNIHPVAWWIPSLLLSLILSIEYTLSASCFAAFLHIV